MGRPRLVSYRFDVSISVNENMTGKQAELIAKLSQLEEDFGRGYVVGLLRQISANAIMAHFGSSGLNLGPESPPQLPTTSQQPQESVKNQGLQDEDNKYELDASEIEIGALAGALRM